MSKSSSLSNIPQELVHFSKDVKPFPNGVNRGCAKCLNRNGVGEKGKSKRFKNPRAKFYHLHLLHQSDKFEYPTLEDELNKLEQLSIANQRGLI